MRILSVTATDAPGRRFNGFAMHDALLARGHTLDMAVWAKRTGEPWVHELRRGPLRVANAGLARLDRALALEGLLAPAGWALPRTDPFRRADLTHWHIVENGNFSLPSLARLSRLKPAVWTVHDAWPTTGMCLHSFECRKWLTGCGGRCPHPRGRSPLRRRTPALHWRLKRVLYRRMDVTLVAGSRWMKERVAASPLLRHLPCEVIPFGVDLELFSPSPRAVARAAFGIAPEERVLACRGRPPATDLYKGSGWLRAALRRLHLPFPVCLLVVDDASAFAGLGPGYRVVEAGWIDDPRRLAALYAAADIWVMPSLQESFGMMAVEAMACGTPAVVGDGTALPSVVQAPRAGLAVQSRDVDALASALHRLLTDEAMRLGMGHAARALAEREYGLDRYVGRHIDLYERTLRRRRSVTPTGTKG